MSKIHTFDLEEDHLEEILSILAKNGRPDLIQLLEGAMDNHYKPTKKEKRIALNDDDCSSGEEEIYSSSDVVIDDEGFWSLR
ncbi:MAG: hypothetical protein ACO3UU_10060 [Minisyncoccia bacterium]